MDERERREDREAERGRGEKGMSREMRPTMARGKVSAMIGMAAKTEGKEKV